MSMLLMLVPMSLSLPPGVISYGYRNCSPPLKRLLAHCNTTNLHHYHHLRRRNGTFPSQLNTLFSFIFFPRNLTCLLTGTGYLTACFALMVGPQGRAVGVEHIQELADSSIKNIKKSAAAPLLKEGSLSIHVGDGRQGWPEFAPYDAIHVGAAAPEIPQPLLDQLKPGGRMVIPVGKMFQDLKVIDKNEDGSISVRSETPVRYVPLTSRGAQLRGC
uniref:Protein-L-isoaspartate O-methyltransferase n=1 Tax=Salix viminalis TaxID=40686 RepID=A0A6N2MDY6_SALVM